MNKLVVTNININGKDKLFSGITDDKGFIQVNYSNFENNDAIGNIYVGKVRDIVKNINAAFVEYAKGKVGYYSLDENKNPYFLNKKNTTKLCQGDEIIVQISKAAVKTKALVLTSNISLTGKYLVLNVNKDGIGFSSKIKDLTLKKRYKNLLCKVLDDANNVIDKNYGVIVRTNANLLKQDDFILEEFRKLLDQWILIKSKAQTRKCYSILYEAQPAYLKQLSGALSDSISEVITDNNMIYDRIRAYCDLCGNIESNITLYNDELLPLNKLYSLETLTKNITSKNVWLKSGAYLVIEPTEAMVVVDVNTGKCIKGKDSSETILKVNIEAAHEIAKQIKLRNLSGIIIIDFINMTTQMEKDTLIKKLTEYISYDSVKTTVIEMTKLDLVEMTRKKTDAPVYEQINE